MRIYRHHLGAVLLAGLLLAGVARAQDYSVMPAPRVQFFDAAGVPLAGGKLYVYEAGTTTSETTYSDNQGTANANPIVLSASGRATVYLEVGESYKFELRDENDSVLWTQDNVRAVQAGGTTSQTLVSLTLTGTAQAALNLTGGGISVNGVQIVNTSGVLQLPSTLVSGQTAAAAVTSGDLFLGQEDTAGAIRTFSALAFATFLASGSAALGVDTDGSLTITVTGGDLTAIDEGDCISVSDGQSTTPEVNLDVNGCAHAANIAFDDRFPMANVNVAGDPTQYVTSVELARYVRDEIPASVALRGTVERATDTEAEAGTDTTRYVTPDQLADHMPDDSVGSDQLRTATFNQSGGSAFTIPGEGYSFLPTVGGTATGDNDLRILVLSFNIDSSHTDFGKAKWDRPAGGEPSSISNISSVFRYLTSSDSPSLWVVLNAAGVVVSMWESEDPISENDTVAPIGIPVDEDGIPFLNHTVVKVGLPALAAIQQVYAALNAADRTGAIDRLGAYVVRRGWLTGLTALSDLSNIVVRYEPSGRQWAMRCAANAEADIPGCERGPVTQFYQDNLAVTAGAWVLAP